MKSLAQGSTRYNLSKSALLDTSVNLPLKPEQSAIVVVLTDMDAGIASLGAHRLKQDLMKELHTWRTRLVKTPDSQHLTLR